MSILKTQLVTTGMADSPISFIFILTNDTSETVTTPGYLNANLIPEDLTNISEYNSALIYTTDKGPFLYTLIVNKVNRQIILRTPYPVLAGAQTTNNIPKLRADQNLIEIVDSLIAASTLLTTVGPNQPSVANNNQMAAGAYIRLDKTAVTQQTSGATAVTADSQCGVITTFALAFAAGANTTFTLNNDKIFANSSIIATVGGGTNTVKNISVTATVTGVGTASIVIVNNSISSTNLNGTVVVNFVVF